MKSKNCNQGEVEVEKDSSRSQFTIKPIGIIHSCFTEKFGIPRQPGMVKSSTAQIELYPPFNREEMVRGLDQFSHIWVHFLFHQSLAEGWKHTIRPPWLGGQKRVGVFASRSPHRPNHIGLSVVKLEGVRSEEGRICLKLSGIDFVDGTPVLDIKPYIPYSDAIETATCGYARGDKPDSEITFTVDAETFCKKYYALTRRNIRQLIVEMIGQDPRPASQKNKKREFGMLLWDVNIRWRVDGNGNRNKYIVEGCEIIAAQ